MSKKDTTDDQGPGHASGSSELSIPVGREAAIAAATAKKAQGPRKTYASRNPGHDTCVRGPLKYVLQVSGNRQTEVTEPALRVRFSEGDNGDEFSTTDIEVQEAIEASDFYGSEFWLITDETPKLAGKGVGPEYTQGVSSTKPAK